MKTLLLRRAKIATIGLVVSAVAASAGFGADAAKLVAVRVAAAPNLDGKANDAAWQSAKPVAVVAKGVMPKTRGTSSDVTVRAAYTDTQLYLLVHKFAVGVHNDTGDMDKASGVIDLSFGK